MPHLGSKLNLSQLQYQLVQKLIVVLESLLQLNQMNFEIDMVNFIVDLGEILWPWAFVLLWVYSIYEGISILQGKYETQGSQNVTVKISEAISSISIQFSSAGRCNSADLLRLILKGEEAAAVAAAAAARRASARQTTAAV